MPPTPRGRPAGAELSLRRERFLDDCEALLLAEGPAGLTVAAITRAAGASRTTLYAWFGGREGVLGALVERNADRTAALVTDALARGSGVPETLRGFARGLLAMLTGPLSVALNRAAMAEADGALAATVLAGGRHRVGPLVEAYLADQDAAGALSVPDPAGAFRALYGLVVADTQVRVLLGEPAPGPDELAALADAGVARFLTLASPRG